MSDTRRQRGFFLFAILAVSLGSWAYFNQPVEEPGFVGSVDGFAYAPSSNASPSTPGAYPSPADMAADLAVVTEHAGAIRTYSLDGTLGELPALAAASGLDIVVGLWLDEDQQANQRRLAELSRAVAQNPNIHRIIVGNETLLSGRLSYEQLVGYLRTVRERFGLSVSTAEPWHIWLEWPELASEVDFLAVHMLPYWEGIGAEEAVAVIDDRMVELAATFPDLPIVIAEVGWPSNGRARGNASASRRDAEIFLRRFLASAETHGYEYFLMEAFDRPWKRADEGEVGAYWGLFDTARNAKYSLGEAGIAVPNWQVLALLSAALAGLAFLLLTTDACGMRWPGFALLAVMSTWVSNEAVWTIHDYLDRYWTLAGLAAAALMLTGVAGMVLLLFIEAHEWAEARFKPRRRVLPVSPARPQADLPMVSIHVPACSEPPAMLIETLQALAELDYPSYEVIVVDNNTADGSLWRPVEAFCGRLGPRFRFYHVESLEGFKAGALNFALERTSADAEIVAVIDSDYLVASDWLKRLAPHFAAPNVAIVQAPQDYRDQASRAFKRVCEAEYRGFFKIGMLTRNDRNAIIQHGTMTMIRADVLREVGGWAEWTVTEDAELGLRILEHGYDAAYAPESCGRGLTPDKFRDYRAQRYRWAIGAAQILRSHGRRLLGLDESRLSAGQRFHFLTGWLAWIGDGLNLLFNCIAIGWSALMIYSPLEFYPPIALFTGFVIALFLFKLVKMTMLYRRHIGASAFETCAAVVAGLSLVYIVGRAVLAGLAGSRVRFVRTPKLARRDTALGAIGAVLPEAALAGLLLASSAGVAVRAPISSTDATLWCLLLVIFAVPHIAAVSLSLLSAAPSRGRLKSAARLEEAVSEISRS